MPPDKSPRGDWPASFHALLLKLESRASGGVSDAAARLRRALFVANGGAELNRDREHATSFLSRMNGLVNVPPARDSQNDVPPPEVAVRRARVKELTELLCYNPTNEHLWIARGNVFMELKQFYDAADDYSAAIRLKPEFAQGYYKRSQSYDMLGYDHLAMQDRKHAKELFTAEWQGRI